MIFKSSHPLSPIVDISVEGVPFDFVSVQQLVLDLSEDRHDMLTMVVTGIPPAAVVPSINAAVSVDWRQGNLGHTFRGYITHINPSFSSTAGTVKGSPLQVAEIVCFGASFVMKAKKNRLWENVTLEGVIKKLSDEYQFSYEVPNDPFQYFRLVQSGESDWEFLYRVVDGMGYSMTMHGTHLHVFDRLRSLGRNISRHNMTVPGRSSLSLQPNQILRMESTIGYVTPESNSNNNFATVLDNRGRVSTLELTSPGTRTGRELPALFSDQLSGTSLSVDYGRKNLAAVGKHRFPFSAHIEATGSPGVVPGGFLDISEFNGEFDGLWYVTDACHTLTRDRHKTTISVIKDTTTGRFGSAVNTTPSLRNPPVSVLRSNTWRSSRVSGSTYA